MHEYSVGAGYRGGLVNVRGSERSPSILSRLHCPTVGPSFSSNCHVTATAACHSRLPSPENQDPLAQAFGRLSKESRAS